MEKINAENRGKALLSAHRADLGSDSPPNGTPKLHFLNNP